MRASLVAVTVGFAAVVSASPVSAAQPVRFFFYNSARTIECRFSNGALACASFKSDKVAVLNSSGVAQIVTIRRFGSRNPICAKPPGDDVPCWFQKGGSGPTLRLGATTTDPDPRIYRCASHVSGIACRSLQSGRGFLISDKGVTRTRD